MKKILFPLLLIASTQEGSGQATSQFATGYQRALHLYPINQVHENQQSIMHKQINNQVSLNKPKTTNMKKFLMFTAILTSSIIASAQSGNKDETAIKSAIAIAESGWNEKSGDKFAIPFAEVHDYIVWNGYYFPNQTKKGTAIAHQQLFDGVYKMLDLKLKVDKIKFIRSDLALVHVYGGMYEKGKTAPEDPGVLMSMLMDKKSGNWEIVSFHNLDLEPFSDKTTADRSPMPLSVMYAGWYKK